MKMRNYFVYVLDYSMFNLVYEFFQDATRISDGAYVTLKVVESSINGYEVEIATFLSSQATDRHNHCVPIYEMLKMPDDDDKTILVMPFL
jgi:hypothetical protein